LNLNFTLNKVPLSLTDINHCRHTLHRDQEEITNSYPWSATQGRSSR